MDRKIIISILFCYAGLFNCGEDPKDDIKFLIGTVSKEEDISHIPTEPENPDPNLPLIVQSTEPANNASLVNITSSITVKFSEAVDPNSIILNTNNSDCTGSSFQISNDGFNTCLQLKPISGSLDGNKTFQFKSSDPLSGGGTYRFRVTNEIKNLSLTKSLLSLGDYSFKTSIPGNKSFIVEFPEKISRLSFLSYINYSDIEIKVRPVEENRTIRQIVLVSQFKDENGITVQAKYKGHGDLDKMYYSDDAGEKSITMYLKDFSPKLDIHTNWTPKKKLRIGANVVYSDGSFGTSLNFAEILMEDEAPSSFDAFGYSILLFINVASFVPSGTDLPKNQWNSWMEATYPDNKILRSNTSNISNTGSGLLSFSTLRPKSGARETLKFHLDTNGDKIPDYTWSFKDFEINSNGSAIYGDAIGKRENDTNLPSSIIEL
ncbi:Ig-like domain-containing protein [Leptospira venezuelensis]|uniref:Ig-like domain-containing protein n=1 Tax=Leptospira venezuelensis TaxID=1958811 RepID=UPI000A36BED8|nr:Ig-like domain-containing protein [Leptospira venezuelensis]